jgi:aryl-alcohol dehydrogenase-like predicted oxidoreductase
MEYRVLGRSGIRVSPLCLGTMMFGGATDADASKRMIARAWDAGINFIDTADSYNAGQSEIVVGEALAERRDGWVLATKIANPKPGGHPHERGLSRKWIMQGVDESLRRLRTDYIDILYLHREDPDTQLELTISALGDLIRAGKIRGFGLSNYRAWRIARVCETCDRLGVDRPIACQPYYNAMNRMPEVEVIPASVHYGLGVVPYSPLARGVLTAKYGTQAPPPAESRAGRGDKRMMEAEWRPESLIIAQKIKAHAEAAGAAASHLAIGWVLNNAHITSAIVGPRTQEQLEDYIEALNYKFTAEDEALIDSLVAAGHPSSPGYNDPQYPIEGRRARTK